jgi:glycosyltransferase involved in cell wall biosynthesis
MQEVFINSGVVKPVYEFKLGVDPKLYFPIKRKPHNQFTFLSVGSPATRKNSQLSVDAFLKVFGKDENYRMIYKSNGPPDARMYFGDMKGAIQHPRIQVIDDEYSHAEFAKLYDEADCVLFPTRGEGWGNLPFQGIAKGIPTICTNALACTEFAEMSVPLDFEWDSSTLFGRYVGCGQWAKPNFDDLCDKMKYVADNYETVSKKTYKNALWISKNMTWEKVSQPYIERIQKILLECGKIV